MEDLHRNCLKRSDLHSCWTFAYALLTCAKEGGGGVPSELLPPLISKGLVLVAVSGEPASNRDGDDVKDRKS